MSSRVLFVDDDPGVLSTFERTLRPHFEIDTSPGPIEALERVGGPERYAVVVSDMRMPVMDGLQLLRRIHDIQPESILLILTGNADLRTAIDAVNAGDIFRFLEKPCPTPTLMKVLADALAQYQLRRDQRELLERTLRGSIQVLSDVLGLVQPEAFGTAARITGYVQHVVSQLQVEDPWQYEVAAMLSQLGCVVVPTDTLEAIRLGRKLSKDEEERFLSHANVARNLLRHIPRLEVAAEIVGRQHEKFSTQKNVPTADRNAATLGAQILRVCTQFEQIVSADGARRAALRSELLNDKNFDPALVALLPELPPEGKAPSVLTIIRIHNLVPGMVLNKDLRTSKGALLVAKGTTVTETLIMRIKNFHQHGTVADEIEVVLPAG